MSNKKTALRKLLAGEKDIFSSATPAVDPETGVTNPYSALDPYSYGFSRREKMRYQQDLQQAIWESELQMRNYQEDYDSPINQAQRLREAGINPNLEGVEPGSSVGMNHSGVNPMENISTNGEIAMNAFNGLTSILSTAMGISTGLSSIANTRLDIAGKKADLALGMRSPAIQYLTDYFTLSDYTNASDFRTAIKSLDPNMLLDDAPDYGSKSANSAFRQQVRQLLSSDNLYNELQAIRNKGVKEYKDYVGQTTTAGYSPDAKVYSDFMRDYNLDLYNTAKVSRQRQRSDDRERMEYNSWFDSKTYAKSENSKFTYYMKDYDFKKVHAGTLHKLYMKVRKKEPGWETANALLFAMLQFDARQQFVTQRQSNIQSGIKTGLDAVNTGINAFSRGASGAVQNQNPYDGWNLSY